jgi:hypothetical protein
MLAIDLTMELAPIPENDTSSMQKGLVELEAIPGDAETSLGTDQLANLKEEESVSDSEVDTDGSDLEWDNESFFEDVIQSVRDEQLATGMHLLFLSLFSNCIQISSSV